MTSGVSTSREHWHARATQLAQLDACLLELIPWDGRPLSQLRADVYRTALAKLDELAAEACRRETVGSDRRDIEREMAKAIWNFLVPWKGSTNVPRETLETTGAT